jgi:WD40 repeat protein
VLSVCFDHTGKKLASGGGAGDNSVRLWSAESGAPIGPPLNGHSDEVNGVCFSPDGFKLASCSDDRSVKIWNLITRECVSTGHSSSVSSVAWNNDGTKLSTGGCYDYTVKVGSAGTFECQSTLTVDSVVTSAAFSPDGCKIAAAHSNKIQLFDTQTQAKLGSTMTGHSDW